MSKSEREDCLAFANEAAKLERCDDFAEAEKLWKKALACSENERNQTYYANRIEFCQRWKKRIGRKHGR